MQREGITRSQRHDADENARLRVAFVIDRLYSDKGGTERQVVTSMDRLGDVGIDVHLVCLYETEWLRRWPRRDEVTILGYRGLFKPNILSVLDGLRRVVDERRIDVVQTFFEDSIFVTWMALGPQRERPILLSSRRDLGLELGQPWYHRIFEAVRPLALARFDGVIANADAAKRYTLDRDRVPANRIQVIHNGIDPAVESTPRPESLADDSVDHWFVQAANFTPVKRHDVLVDALARLMETRPGLRFRAVLLGEGPTEAEIRDQVHARGLENHVVFEGSVPDVGAYLAHAHIGILCSQREGLSNAILEYMKYGLPVVATAVGGSGELVDASNGRLVAPNDPIALASAITELIDDDVLRVELGRESRRRIERAFSWESTSRRTREAYEAYRAAREDRTRT